MSLCVCRRKERQTDRQRERKKREENNSETRCTLSHAVIHLLVHCKQTHTKARAHTHTSYTLTHLASQEAVGASGTEQA